MISTLFVPFMLFRSVSNSIYHVICLAQRFMELLPVLIIGLVNLNSIALSILHVVHAGDS